MFANTTPRAYIVTVKHGDEIKTQSVMAYDIMEAIMAVSLRIGATGGQVIDAEADTAASKRERDEARAEMMDLAKEASGLIRKAMSDHTTGKA